MKVRLSFGTWTLITPEQEERAQMYLQCVYPALNAQHTHACRSLCRSRQKVTASNYNVAQKKNVRIFPRT